MPDAEHYGPMLFWGWVLIGALVFLAFLIAFTFPKTWVKRLLAVAGVAAFLSFTSAQWFWRMQINTEDFRLRLSAAEKTFSQRCLTATQHIDQTIPRIAGVRFQPTSHPTPSEDPLGQLINPQDDHYLKEFLTSSQYQFVDQLNPTDNKLYRVTLDKSGDKLERQEIPANVASRYAITQRDITTPEDRQHWIAGNSLQIIDLESKTVIGEQITYIHDRWLGSRLNGRDPWENALRWSCTAHVANLGEKKPVHEELAFIKKVLLPI